jgi:outer membrane protein assembly factor BamA
VRAAIVSLSLLSAATAHAEPLEGAPDRLSEPSNNVAQASTHPSFVAMPIPMSDPAIGTGLGIAAMALYNEDAGGPWTTGVGGLYTDNGTWAAALFHKAHFDHDRYRLTAAVAYGNFNLDFYGIGAEAGSRDVSIGLNEKGYGVLLNALVRVRPHAYLGLRLRALRVDTTVNDLDLPFPDLDLPPLELQSTTSALGLAAQYDTRDNQFAPRRGLLFNGNVIYAAEAFGSDFEYPRTELQFNGYQSVGETVVAWRGSVCWSGDDTPFYDLCSFGTQNDLRGYTAGQFRDHAMFAIQAELRRHFFWRIGGVAFAGVGGVANDFGSFEQDQLLPAAGVGLRIEASRRYHVNLSVDYAVGDDSSAVYFYVGEAF